MRVKVEMIVETDDFGEAEFRREVEALIADIDSRSRLLEFEMFRISDREAKTNV